MRNCLICKRQFRQQGTKHIYCSNSCYDKDKPRRNKTVWIQKFEANDYQINWENVANSKRILQYYNIKLKKHEAIHHIDGNEFNNRRENILVVTQSQHSKIHSRAYKFLALLGFAHKYLRWLNG